MDCAYTQKQRKMLRYILGLSTSDTIYNMLSFHLHELDMILTLIKQLMKLANLLTIYYTGLSIHQVLEIY